MQILISNCTQLRNKSLLEPYLYQSQSNILTISVLKSYIKNIKIISIIYFISFEWSIFKKKSLSFLMNKLKYFIIDKFILYIS